MNNLDLVDGEVGSLIRISISAIAAACPSTSGHPEASHDGCWTRLRDLGFATLRSSAEASTADALIVIEEMAGAVCGAPMLFAGVLVPELLRFCGVDDPALLDSVRRGSVGLVLREDLREVGSGRASEVCVGAGAAVQALTLDGLDVGIVPLGQLNSTLDLSASARRPSGTVTHLGRLREEDLARFRILTLLAVAADALGASTSLLRSAIGYSRDRVQFDRPIGSFQAVQHLCADAYWQLDALRSVVLYGAWALDRDLLDEAHEAAIAAKAFTCRATRSAVANSMQVFGGIAMTWEHHAHRHLRRVLIDEELFGNASASNRAMFDHMMAGSDGLR